MVQTASSSNTNIQAEIQGEISGQIAVGNHNLQIHAEHGALVNVISGDVTAPRPRATPVLSLRPRRVRGLLDRQAELSAVTQAILSELPVEIHGDAGIGKTSMLRHIAYQPEVDRFSAGVVYLAARREAPADLLQFLFDAFYEGDVPCKPTDTQVRHFLRDTRALVLLDDLELTREGFEGLMDAVPSCSFIVATASRRLWGDVQSIAMSGLPNEDALALVERELGRSLTSEDRESALALCASVGGSPLRILQEAAAAREERRSLVISTPEEQRPSAPGKVSEPSLPSLSESQRSILGVLAALGGSARAEHLAALCALPELESDLHRLEERNLVQAEGSRWRLTGNLAAVLQQTWDLKSRRESALTYFTTWAEQHQHAPDSLLEEADSLRELLDWAGATGRWREAQRLGRAMEGALTLSGRWEAWRSIIQAVLQASRALGDEAGAGWAFHQLGSRALCLTEESDARNYLSQALEIRESLGDRVGAAVTRHNLEILVGPAAPADHSGSSAVGSGAPIKVPLLLKVAGSALLVGLGGLGLWKAFGDRSIPVPTEFSAKVASSSEVDLSWSDQSDSEVEFRIERSRDGVFSEVARVPADSTRFRDANLAPNTSYTYRLRAASSDDISEYSSEIPVLMLPAAPSALSVQEVSPTRLDLGWVDNSPSPSAFKIQRSTDGGGTFGDFARVASGAATYSDTAIPGDASTLYYRVSATNASGDSGYSNLAVWSAKPKPPVAPRLIGAQAASASQVNLRWEDGSDNESGFKIERRSSTGSYRQIAMVDANATSYEDRNLESDTAYAYRMRATNGAGDSAYTDVVGASTPPALPLTPGDLAATLSSSGNVALSWRDNSDNEAGFYLERKAGGDPYRRIRTLAAGATRFADSGLEPQISYAYRVQAFNRAGGSAFSNEATITTPALPGRIEVSATGVRFAPVAAGSTATAEIRITNTGRGTLDGSIGIAGGPFKVISQQTSFSLSPAGPLLVTMEFAPAEPGDFTGTLTIKSSDPRRPAVQLPLFGSAKKEPVAVQLLSLNLAAQQVIGGESAEGKVTLNGAAPANGTTVTVSSSNPAVRVQRNVVIGAGETSAAFGISTMRVPRNTSVTISASLGQNRRSEILEVRAVREPQPPDVSLESLSLTARVLAGGESAEGKVGLSNVAPAGGVKVSLSSSNPAVTVQQSVLVRAGESSAVFTIMTTRVARNTRATVSASLGQNRRSEVLEVRAQQEPQPPEVRLESLTLRPARVRAGQRSLGTVKLSSAAPRDIIVAISSSNSQIATGPATVTVKEGSSNASFAVTTRARSGPGGVVGLVSHRMSALQSQEVSVTFTASFDGRSATAILRVRP